MTKRIFGKPPNDEQDRMTRDKVREERQKDALDAILDRTNFDLVYILTTIPPSSPYDNYPFPDKIEELEFALKGLLRLEMIGYSENSQEYSYDEARKFRRLLGTTKKRWKIADTKDLPRAWRSRLSFKVFLNGYEARNFLETDPLRTWESYFKGIDLNKVNFESNQKYVLLHVNDVELNNGKRLSSLLEEFIKDFSKIFKLISISRALDFRV